MKRRYKFDKPFLEYILKTYEYDLKAASKDIGCHYNTMLRNIKKFGVYIPSDKRKKKTRTNEKRFRPIRSKFHEWYINNPDKHDLTVSQMAKEAEVSYKTAYQYFRNNRNKALKFIQDKLWRDYPDIFKDENGKTVKHLNRVEAYVSEKRQLIKFKVETTKGETYNYVIPIIDIIGKY
jgi:hypothetical protein